jgi:hypothetical protein
LATAQTQRLLLIDVLSADFGFSQSWRDRVARRRSKRRYGAVTAAVGSDAEAAAEDMLVDVVDAAAAAAAAAAAPSQASRLPTLRRTAPLVAVPLVNVGIKPAATTASASTTSSAPTLAPKSKSAAAVAVPVAAASTAVASSSGKKRNFTLAVAGSRRRDGCGRSYRRSARCCCNISRQFEVGAPPATPREDRAKEAPNGRTRCVDCRRERPHSCRHYESRDCWRRGGVDTD